MCNKEKFWPALCEALGHWEWVEDPRFKTFKKRLKNRAIIENMLDEALKAKKTEDWLKVFAGRVPSAPLHNIKSALDNPFVTESGRIKEINLEGYGTYRSLDTPIKTDHVTPSKPAPKLGQHTNHLLRSLGYDEKKIL